MIDPQLESTAEKESERALDQVLNALHDRQNFRLEAGAGAGKTYSLVKALRHILDNRSEFLPRSDQQVACLTYTKVARDEIVRRTDGHPTVFADTLHGFLWESIRPHQKALRQLLAEEAAWVDHLDPVSSIDAMQVTYDLGIRGVDEASVKLHHDDVPALAIKLFQSTKFRDLLADRFPFIFVDEYQDTPVGLVEAMLGSAGGRDAETQRSPTLGFFGDHWQQIYDRTCGSISHPAVHPIAKNANFRSDTSIVDMLNTLRPELPQAPAVDAEAGTVTVYHTNQWPGQRLTRNWKGQISHEATRATLSWVAEHAKGERWHAPSNDTKTLMLTHASIANELGYSTLPRVFKYNDAFAKKENATIEFLVDVIEPATVAFLARRYGLLFDILGGKRPYLKARADKVAWIHFFDTLTSMCETGTVGEVLDHLTAQSLFSVPTRIQKIEGQLAEAINALEAGEELKEPRRLVEHRNLRAVPYREIRALSAYIDDKTVFSTKHGVKGAEFDNVIVVLGRGWSTYDFAKMLGVHRDADRIAASDAASYVRSRNLFYVAASRARHNLVLVFTQMLDAEAVATLKHLVGDRNVMAIDYVDEETPSGVRQDY